MSDPAAKTLHDFSALPVIGRREVSALAPDPEHARGVIVALSEQGIAYLQADDRN